MAEPGQVQGSLRNRLAVTLIGGAALLALLLFLVVRSYAAQIAQQGQDSILTASVSSILDAAVLRDDQVEIDFPYAAFSMLTTAADDQVYYAIYRDGGFLSGYADLPQQASSAVPKQFQTALYDGKAVRISTASRTLLGADVRTRITVSVAQTQDALSETLNQISTNVASFGLGFFMLAVLLSFWVTSVTIAPLKRLTTSVTRRGPQDLRPLTKPVPSEMLPLVNSLNTLMGRLNQSLSQSEDFIAEAAHRVRTPLATVRSYAETTLQRVDKEENRQALRSMVRAIDESSRAAGQLLDHAMITFRADHLEHEDLDLGDLVQELVQRLTPVAEMKDIDLVLQIDRPVRLIGDAILLQNAIRNLIDNALKYSPSESVIEISVTASPNPQVAVRDQGAGFPSDEIADLAQRFSRGNNARGTIGSGLGLTIAQDVAAAHGGSLTLSNTAGGGACVIFSV
ncbi:sensor histidine kinase [Pseudophaeobacter flagellatus]|uniref:sensor histidine kinase n=1 Tax=Pseudophaeobacter flagellatus TaxID=2899119 RepID=UPI001E462B5A|nr:sensor histidine kinase [Pseudophaeobacter flagellatus]MCD9148700.1 sensor histidine kinase N-terminal domain-containing protein [Pseudophaeobacter flagellatus]